MGIVRDLIPDALPGLAVERNVEAESSWVWNDFNRRVKTFLLRESQQVSAKIKVNARCSSPSSILHDDNLQIKSIKEQSSILYNDNIQIKSIDKQRFVYLLCLLGGHEIHFVQHLQVGLGLGLRC